MQKKDQEELKFTTRQLEHKNIELENAYKELVFQSEEKEKRAAELVIVNKELVFQNADREKRATELIFANKELQQKNQEIALSKYNKRFLTEFSEKFSAYKLHNEFFSSLIQFIADTTGMDYVFVGKLEQNEKGELSIQTIALNAFGKPADNINYPLPDGPCEQVIQGTLYSYPDRCRQTFPKNKTIDQFNVEGYLAYPLYEQGDAVGLIAVMHQKPIEDAETVSSVLKIVAKRAELELERIKNEEQLVQHNKTLEERTKDLEQANKNLEISNASLEQFAYVASHDLQEPLRKIQTFAGRLLGKEKEELSEDLKSDISKIITAADRMRKLIGDVLNYSRIIYDDHSYIETDLNKILNEVLIDFDLLIDQKKAVINFDTLPVIEAVPLQMSQLFYNLFANAVKFSKKDIPPVINITSNKLGESQLHEHPNLESDKEYFEIVIKDNGIGFKQEYAEQIFTIFQRLNGFNEYAGTGIGLAMCRKIVLNHGGLIYAEAKENEGATFHIILPAKQG